MKQYLKGIDPFTGEAFEKKRSNQRFASPKNKSDYHNANLKAERAATGPWLKKVQNNRKILSKVVGDKDEKSVTKDFLLGAGFDFIYFTGRCNDGKSHVIFEYEYTRVIDTNNIIIKRG